MLALGFAVGCGAHGRVGRHPGARRAQLPDVPRRQRVEHARGRSAGQPARARPGWPAWTPARRTCIPTSVPRTILRTRTACPTPWCPRRSPKCPSTFQYADESDPGPYPFSASTPIEGGQGSTGDRHAIMVNPATCTLYELYDAHYSASGSTAGSGAIWNLQLERAPAGRLDVGRRGRTADPPRARALRRGAVGRHHPRHPDDGRRNRHLVPVARPPRGRDVVEPEPAADGRTLPAQGRLQHLGLLPAGPGRVACHAAVRADPGRQRLQLVLRGHGRQQLAHLPGQRAQAGAGQRVRGGRRVATDDRPELGSGPPTGGIGQLRIRYRDTAWWPPMAASSPSASPSSAPWAASTSTRRWSAWPRRPGTAGTGRWRPTAASSATGTRTSTARPGPSASTNRSSAWRRRPAAAATGSWRPTVASSATATHTSTARPVPSASTHRSSAWR